MTESQEAEGAEGAKESGGLGPWESAMALGGPNPHLLAGLRQQIPVWPQRLLLMEGDQGN